MRLFYVAAHWQKKNRCLFPALLITLLMLAAKPQAHAQITITTPYPAPAQSLTRGLDTSLLTVEVNFLSACNNNVVTITLAPGVNYIPGSVTKTAGSASFTINDLGGTANAPTFSIGGVTAAGSITFTIRRTAGCGAASSGKDAVSVTSSCGSATENNMSVNTYSLFAPVLSFTPPAALTNAVVGQTATRTATMTNGGNGCIDTVHYYVVYPNGGIVNTAAGNQITANGVPFTPVATHGDTLFYSIAGATVFGGDNLMCNGETVTIAENIRIVKCNTTTAYGMGWGKAALCQAATGSSIITMATGVANITASFTRVQELNWCQKGIINITYTNTGSAGNANAAYHILANVGYSNQNATSPPQGSSAVTANVVTHIDSAKVGTTTVPLIPITTTQPAAVNFPALTSDPDGPGVGLEDLDGDGFYDDLAPGQSVTVTVYEHWIDNSLTCPLQPYYVFTNHTLGYSNMCGSSFTTNALAQMGTYRVANVNASVIAPPEVEANKPFTVQLCVELGALARPNYKPKDSMYFDITLPAGVALSGTGNITYDGLPLTASSGNYTLITSGGITTVHIARKGSDARYCFSADLVNDCSAGGGPLSIGINNYYIGDTCSASRENYVCTTKVVSANCNTPCANDGVSNYIPTATRTSLGYTDATMTTKVAPATVTGIAKYTGLPLDTFHIIVPGKQSAIAGSYGNLYYDLQFGKANGENVMQFVNGIFNQYRSGSTIATNAMAAPVDGGSTASQQAMHWDLTGNLAAATINDGDSVWLDITFAVTKANGGLLYGANLTQVPGISTAMYNLDASSNKMGCAMGHSINMLLAGVSVGNATLGGATITNCTAQTANSGWYGGYGAIFDIFPNEYRPFALPDSILVTLPAGYNLVANRINGITWSGLTNYVNTPNATNGIVAQTGTNQWKIKNPYLSSGGWPITDLINVGTSNYGAALDVVATCAAVTGSQQGSITWYVRSYAYAGTASQVNNINTGSGFFTYNAANKPAIAVQNNTGTVQGVLPQHYWDIQVNSTATATASYIWMALEKAATSGITIDSVVLKPSNVVLSPISYGAGNNWYQISATGLAGGTNQSARVYFKYSNCTNDSILMRAGWNCSGYPASPAAYSCATSDQYLKIAPENSQVQVAIGRQPANGGVLSLCSDDSVTVIVNSAQAANVTNPYVTIYPPAGATLSSPIEIEYPLGSGNWQTITPIVIAGGGYQLNLGDHTGIGANGLPGTSVNPAAAGRQAKIRVPFAASCSFVSGSELAFSVFGTKPCGDNATGNGLSVNTTPVNISGAVVAGNAAVSLSLAGSNAMSCGASKTLSFSVTEVGTASVAGDTAVYTIPAGLGYVSGSFSGCPSCTVITTPGTAGSTLVKVALPVGLPSGTVTNYAIDVAPQGAGCGTFSVGGQVERNITGLTCGAIACTSSKVIIGTGTPVSLTLSKPDLNISSLSPVGMGFQPGSTATIALTIQNLGSVDAAANTYTVEFFCGSNTTPFASTLFPQAITAGSNASANLSVNVPAIPTCLGGDFLTAMIRPLTDGGQQQCICSQTMLTTASPLPITLTSFNGTAQGCNAVLTWETAMEHKFDRFEIEYSNGATFYKVGTIAGKNNTQGSAYSFTYAQVAGKGYYRLKMVDVDGKYSYSKTVEVNTNCGVQPITLYPNPAHEQITLTNLQAGNTIRIYDNLGRQVQQVIATGTIENIGVTALSTGSYHVVVTGTSGVLFQVKLVRE